MSGNEADRFFDALGESLAGKTFVKLTLGKYRGGEPELKNVYARLVEIRKREYLSLLYRYRTRDVVKNEPAEAGVGLLRGLLGTSFLSGHLFTSERDLQLEYNKRREPRLVERPPTFTAAPDAAHDRRKRRHVEAEGSLYLRELGVTNERGEVRERMGDKFRQIDKFVEVVAGLYSSSRLSGRREITVVDMGSGKGYLTFAVYDYFNNTLGLAAHVTGVEAREGLVRLSNEVARRAGFGRLEFRAGLISDTEVGAADVLIALHACDTATDDALFKGVSAGASIIITAPCCHKQVRPQIEPPETLRVMLRHGHLLEREAEMVTDSLRALLLESAGYRVKVFEFVPVEHTAKNTMIAAVRQEASTAPAREAALRQYRALKEFYGVREQRLEELLMK